MMKKQAYRNSTLRVEAYRALERFRDRYGKRSLSDAIELAIDLAEELLKAQKKHSEDDQN